MKFRYFLLLLPAALLAGCASEKPKFVDLNLKYITTNSAPVQSTDKKAQSMLAKTAQSVDSSLQQLSAIQMATHPDVKIPSPQNPVAIGMAQRTSLDWTGPLQPLLQKIANASKYKVRVLGKKPAIPTIVAINATNEPLANILRDTQYQVAYKARIKLYPKSKVIELRYLTN